MSAEFAWLTIEQVAPLIANRTLSPRELLESLFRHIQQHEPRINAFITVDVDGARADAARAESEILHGHYRGAVARCAGSHQGQHLDGGAAYHRRFEILADFTPVEDATVIHRCDGLAPSSSARPT